MKNREANALSLASSRLPWEPSPLLTAKGAAEIWIAIVGSVTDDHFAQSDEIALANLCDAMARYQRVSAALEKQPMATTNVERLRLRRTLMAELSTLRAHIASLVRTLRLAPISRRMQDRARTDLPTRNRKAKHISGDDLFAC